MGWLRNFEVLPVQKMIRKLNARLRAKRVTSNDALQKIIDESLEQYQTESGLISASRKTLQALNRDEFAEFQGAINTVTELLDSEELINVLAGQVEPDDLWLAVDKARTLGTPPDSGGVQAFIDALKQGGASQEGIKSAFADIIRVGTGELALYELDDKLNELERYF